MKTDDIIFVTSFFILVFAILEYCDCLTFATASANVSAFALGMIIKDWIKRNK